MKNIKPLLFILLSLFTLTGKAFFKNATIENVKPYTENTYELTCKIKRTKNGDQLNIENQKSTENQDETIYDNYIATFSLPKEESKTSIIPFCYSSKWPDKENNHDRIGIEFLDPTFDRSIYKAKMLLYIYWLEKSDYWEKNGKDKKQYSTDINMRIKKFKILSSEPLEITERAHKKYSDVRITCVN